ncbi:UDP-glucose--hexose-1-phosphate uridylyltransferase [Paenibacillus sp. YN15]|uniref:UDP-glucose--hexose-1-phosphate uridylyltransferase n=1 Tax=Paenibacillus sp. YN15 TaxID=1742774 RepID=UPI000DCEC55F|nr:UDP-glucose--hexose-1-phosphate uridylyltransferase [Paenibacillus sp. YN15]RAU99845.1 galactose-1-phosphate uridylyltransferase [Paenibacillus sp. YN15]
MAHNIAQDIALLVRFGVENGMLGEGDDIVAVNGLLDLLQVAEPYDGLLPEEREESPAILGRILDYAAEKGILPDNTSGYRDLLDARIMGLLMPRQSEVARSFWETARNRSVEEATDRFYKLSIDSNYIRMDRIRKNSYWPAPTEYGDLEITINLSKPEKDPKEIAAERALPQSKYPKCLLCVENIGYAGRLNHPARQNHRVIPLTLEGNPWYFQYSPYVYYNEHCIIFNAEHTPMQISQRTFVRLLDFIGQFGHYFIGSNADLPIVGGSILSHDHFQGGRHVFPMEKAAVEQVYLADAYPGIKIGRVKWPMSVVRISGQDKEQLVALASALLDAWRGYTDEAADILAESAAEGGAPVPHNTITPIARRNSAGEFELDLVLRNNRTSEEHPMGIFHPHANLHHIKKENIGLIEVMGLAVLPGRLLQELDEIAGILKGEWGADGEWNKNEHPLSKHAEWIGELLTRYGSSLTGQEAAGAMQREVGLKFAAVLADAGVYKRTEAGIAAYDRFMEHMGFRRV